MPNFVATGQLPVAARRCCGSYLAAAAAATLSLAAVPPAAGLGLGLHAAPSVASDACLDLLVGAARACRAERRPFSITDFVATPPEALNVLPPSAEPDEEAKAAVNISYPGLRPLDAQRQVYLVENFLSAEECAALIRAAGPQGFVPSRMAVAAAATAGPHEQPVHWAPHGSAIGRSPSSCASLMRETAPCAAQGHRNSSSFWLGGASAAAQAVRRKVHALLPGLRHGHCHEEVHLTRYTAGGFYSRHSDGRRATVLVYLSSRGAVGGATSFPYLDLRVPPTPGWALIFFPTHADGRRKAEMVHVAEELEAGEKFVAQQWIDIVGQAQCHEGADGYLA
mmetsp:Transcript_93541/g.260460  ORF Transcript_93541/g.260460 Transcript_93541/m.260460 type:complete len:338 (-) Transcript_93541:13-1026(-)